MRLVVLAMLDVAWLACAALSWAEAEPAEANPSATSSAETAPSVYGLGPVEYIHVEPDIEAPVIGSFRAGQQIALRTIDAEPRVSSACPEGWLPIEPRGWVCVGHQSTTGPGHATWLAARSLFPKLDLPYPLRYGIAAGSPRYRRIPTREEQNQNERHLEKHLDALSVFEDEEERAKSKIDMRPAGKGPSDELLAHYATVTGPVAYDDDPAFEGLKFGWSDSFDAEGRTWLVTPDLALIPKDKVRISDVPTLEGLDLRALNMKLPVAFVWRTDAKKYLLALDGTVVDTGLTWKRHEFIPVGKRIVKHDGKFFTQVEGDIYIESFLITIIKPYRVLPQRIKAKQKWISVRVTHGYFIAYEGLTPVYAGAMSPGIHGVQPKPYASPRGSYIVRRKTITADMDGTDNGKYWRVEDVPHTMFFKDSYALHGAWWHNYFGHPRSHGCINLTPADALWLSHWTDPVLPEGWYAADQYYPDVPGTLIVIRP